MRLHEWPQLLDAQIELARSRPFAYGSFDCCLFAADCVLAMTGQDPAEQLRGSYQDELQGRELLVQLGGLEQLAREAFGEPINKAMAQRGDLVLAPLAEGEADCAGICIGHYFAFPTVVGLRFARRELVRLAFRVP